VNAASDVVLRWALISGADPQTKRHVLEDRHVAEQGVMLKDEAHPTVPRIAPGRIITVEQHRADVRRLEAGDHAQQRGLAGSRRSEQRNQLARMNGDADVAQRDEAAEGLREVPDFNAHRAFSVRGSS
jgi:hypothetical protein